MGQEGENGRVCCGGYILQSTRDHREGLHSSGFRHQRHRAAASDCIQRQLYDRRIGGIRILVPSYQLEAALQIFDQAEEVEEASTAQAFLSRPIRSGFAVFVQWFLGVPLPVWNRWLKSSEEDPPASNGH
jgi:hypothetical protein